MADENEKWIPCIGDKVRATEHCPDSELWNRVDLFVMGINCHLDLNSQRYSEVLDITVSHSWPEITEPTDGFLIGRSDAPDELEPVSAS